MPTKVGLNNIRNENSKEETGMSLLLLVILKNIETYYNQVCDKSIWKSLPTKTFVQKEEEGLVSLFWSSKTCARIKCVIQIKTKHRV